MTTRIFKNCKCGAPLPQTDPEDATYVLSGRPLCSHDCFVRFGFGPESDWDCPPVRVDRTAYAL